MVFKSHIYVPHAIAIGCAVVIHQARTLLLQVAEEVNLKAGAILMREGDPSDCMFFITDGVFILFMSRRRCTCSRLTFEGAVSIIKSGVEIARQENGGVLGEMGILTDQPRTATVRCVGGEQRK